MAAFIGVTLQLYHRAILATWRSFLRAWMMIVLIILAAILMAVTSIVAAPLGMVGGFILGAANALVIGATLSLTEQAVLGSRPLRWSDLPVCAGQYFWEVLSIGFVVWFPLLILDLALQANPYRVVLTAAAFFLVFVLLNPIPEVIYQVRSASVFDSLRESYAFILENWIEWFLPLGILLAPFGLSFFFHLSNQAGRLGGLDFWQILTLPFYILSKWFMYVGLSESLSGFLTALLTPIATVFMLLFRGHLFAALHGSSRRQRLFQARSTLR